jgi:CHASE3 domain sensor protein
VDSSLLSKDPGGKTMARDIKRMTRFELESELVAERAAARRSNMIIIMMTVLALLGFMVMAGTVAPFTG